MAEKPSSNAATDLALLIRCPVCLEDMEDARSLPCGHVYCTECLKSLLSLRGWRLNCPTCRLDVQVPNGDVSNLTRNYLVDGLVDNLKKSGLDAATSEPEHEFATLCKNHPEKACELFCKKCLKHVCCKCISTGGTCNQHEYESIGWAVRKCRKNVENLLQKNEKLLLSVERRCELLDELKAKQSDNVREVSQEMSDIFSKHVDQLLNRKVALELQAFDIQWQNEDMLSSEEKRVELEKDKIENTIKLCRKILDIQDPVLFLQTSSGIQDKIFQAEPQELASHVEVMVSNFLHDNDSLLADVISNFGSVFSFGEGCALKEEETRGAARPSSNAKKFSSSIRPASPSPFHEPDHASVSRPVDPLDQCNSLLARVDSRHKKSARAKRNITKPAVWKFYNKDLIDLNLVTFEDNGSSVRTRSPKNTTIIGKPGYKRGKHSWRVRVTHFPDGLSVGICLGRYNRANLVCTYDSGFTKPRMERDVLVELDCDLGELSISPAASDYQLILKQQTDVLIRFDNPENCEIYPYFGLPSPGRYDFSKITVLSIDGIVMKTTH